MTQQGAVFIDTGVVHIDLPEPETEVLQGIKWGSLASFPTPAYWAYQVFAKRVEGTSIQYKLGRTLKEEVGACLLGGHGIPAKVGLAAYESLRDKGAFENKPPTEDILLNWLTEPLPISGKLIRYRFAKQKARYLAAALTKLEIEVPPTCSGIILRNWLTQIPGIGLKTASWISRNWLDADDVAILDIHILRAGIIGGFFEKHLTVERHYLELEQQFISFSHAINVRPSELDAVIWLEMMSSPRTVHGILNNKLLKEAPTKNSKSSRRRPPNNRETNPHQSTLLI